MKKLLNQFRLRWLLWRGKAMLYRDCVRVAMTELGQEDQIHRILASCERSHPGICGGVVVDARRMIEDMKREAQAYSA